MYIFNSDFLVIIISVVGAIIVAVPSFIFYRGIFKEKGITKRQRAFALLWIINITFFYLLFFPTLLLSLKTGRNILEENKIIGIISAFPFLAGGILLIVFRHDIPSIYETLRNKGGKWNLIVNQIPKYESVIIFGIGAVIFFFVWILGVFF